jgi:nitrogen fixation/metabolism regulation signal transduction histidine kinase
MTEARARYLAEGVIKEGRGFAVFKGVLSKLYQKLSPEQGWSQWFDDTTKEYVEAAEEAGKKFDAEQKAKLQAAAQAAKTEMSKIQEKLNAEAKEALTKAVQEYQAKALPSAIQSYQKLHTTVNEATDVKLSDEVIEEQATESANKAIAAAITAAIGSANSSN